MNKIILTCGISGSGKTCYARSLERRGYIRLSVDEAVWSKYGPDFSKLPLPEQRKALTEASEEILARLLRHIEAGDSVVVDSTMCKRFKRDRYRDACIRAFGVNPLIVYFDTPLPLLRERLAIRKGDTPNDQIVPTEHLETFFDNFEQPREDENFIVIDQNLRRLLIIVDPQIDFVNGSLPVPGAKKAMEALADHLIENNGRYVGKVITADRHPYDHCSFKEEGGEWPRHCVHDTVGAAIWPAVFDAAYSTHGPVMILHKGQSSDREEYSIFQNREASLRIKEAVEENAIDQIDICGLAGDVCVSATAADARALFGEARVKILHQFSPTIK